MCYACNLCNKCGRRDRIMAGLETFERMCPSCRKKTTLPVTHCPACGARLGPLPPAPPGQVKKK